jgi:putative flippase GtrA
VTEPVRLGRYVAVSALGMLVQLAVVAVAAHLSGAGPAVATAVGVSAAILHNFVWHRRWTWGDRRRPGASWPTALARFVAGNGLVSLVGSVLIVPVLANSAGVPVVPANVAALAACGLLNYWIGGRVCFPVP